MVLQIIVTIITITISIIRQHYCDESFGYSPPRAMADDRSRPFAKRRLIIVFNSKTTFEQICQGGEV